MRVFAETAVGFLLTIVLSVAGLAVFWTVDGGSTGAADVWGDAVASLVFGMGIGLVVWLILLVIGNFRNRGRSGTRRFVTTMISALIAIVVDVAIVAVYSFATGGWAVLYLVFAVAAAVAFLVAAIVAGLLVHLVLFRRPEARPDGSSGRPDPAPLDEAAA